MHLHKLDQAFWHSKEGKELIQEWKDVGEVLKKHIKKTKDGYHFDNKHMDDLEDELEDVEDEYKELHAGKGGWKKRFDAAWKASFKTKQFGSVVRRAKAFKKSKQGAMLKKEVLELKAAIKQHLKISDVKEDSDSDSDDEELVEQLKITVSKAGQNEIEKEANDVKATFKKIEHSRVFRNLKASFMRWAHSKEMKAIHALDKKFMASPAGKRLMKEWRDFGELLKKSIVKTKNGIHIKNEDALEDEMEDIEDEYKALKGSKWDKAYHALWKKAVTNKEAASLGRRANTFKHSAEGKALKKEMKELKMALKKHVKVEKDSDSSSDDEEDLAEELKITIAKAGQKAIEKEMNDVEAVWKKIDDSKVVKELGMALKNLEESKQMKDIEALDKKFMQTKRGKKMAMEIEDVFKQLDDSVYHNSKGIHIDNEDLNHLDDEITDVIDEVKSFKKSKWAKMYKAKMEALFRSKEAQVTGAKAHAFDKSAEGKALKKEVKEVGEALKKHVKVTDVPTSFEEEDLFLF